MSSKRNKHHQKPPRLIRQSGDLAAKTTLTMTLANITLENGNTCRIFKNSIADKAVQFTVKRGKKTIGNGKWMPENSTLIGFEGLHHFDVVVIRKAIIEALEKEREQVEEHRYWRTGGHNGPTGHGEICMSDADPGL